MLDIYPEELVLKLANDSQLNSPFLTDDVVRCKLYDKRDEFSFRIVNFPFLCGNVPTSQSYGVFTSQLVRYARGCMYIDDFVSRSQILFSRLMNQGFRCKRLQSTFRKFQHGKHRDLCQQYHVSNDFLFASCVNSKP